MKFGRQLSGRLKKNICATLLILSFALIPVSKDLSVQKSEAFLGDSVSGTALFVKEYILDPLVYAIINMVLEEMVNDLTEWVQSGFRDSPGFVTDFDGFLLNTADLATGEFLLVDGPLEFLCSPFKLDIRLALEAQYLSRGAYYKPECSITEAFDNIEGFLDGDFYQGGWDAWASLTLNPRNNVYGSIFEAQGELSATIAGAQRQEIAYLDFGSGFFGVEECDEDDNCTRVTPGAIVQEGISNSLNIGNERLTIADELDEFLAALLTQLLSSVFTNDGGLANFDASAQYNGYDPIQAAGQQAIDDLIEENVPDPGDPGGTGGDIDDPIPGPDCFDGIQNQDETGVDTGGICALVPPPPTLTAEAGFCGGIIVQWGNVTNAVFYDLRDHGVQINVNFGTWFPHSGLTPGSTHSYIVRAVPSFYLPTGTDWSSPPAVETAPRACTQEEINACINDCEDGGLPNCSARCSVLTNDSL